MKFGKTDLIRRINDVVRNGWSNVHVRDLIETLWRDPYSMRTSGFVKEGGTDSLIAAEVTSTVVEGVTLYAIVFQITPKGKKFDFYQFREILTYHKKYAAEVISFDAEEGLHVVYYDFDPDTFEQVLMHIHNPSHDDLLEMMEWVVPITFLYYDAEKHEIIYFGDNRHGSWWNPWIHFAWHQTFNSMRESGLEFTDLIADGDGSSDTHAQFGVSAGTCFHEDIYATADAQAAPADFPVWYFKAGNLPRIHETSVNSLVIDGLLCYNSGGGVGPATEGYFVMYHIFFTNDILEPFISIMGQAQYEKVSTASLMVSSEVTQVKDLLPHQNLLHIGTLLFQTSALYGNSYHSRIVSQTFGVKTKWTTVGDGSEATPVMVDNDEENPTPGKLYGTDPVTGVKGWVNIDPRLLNPGTPIYLHVEDSSISGYKQGLFTEPEDAMATYTADADNSTGEVLIKVFDTGTILNGKTIIPAGPWIFCHFMAVDAGTASTVVFRIFKRTAAGAETEIFNFEQPITANGATEHLKALPQSQIEKLADDILVFKYYHKNSSITPRTMYLWIEGDDVAEYMWSRVNLPIPAETPGDDFVTEVTSEDDEQYPISYLYYRKGGVNYFITEVGKANGLVFGGDVTWIELLTFSVGVSIYYILAVLYRILIPTEITLDAADPDDPRIDVIAVDNTETVIVIKGTPAANPQKPTCDPASQIELTSVLIPAGATTPSGITDEVVYDENTEWTGTGVSVTVDFDSTVQKFHGSKSADVGSIDNNDYLKFVAAAPKDRTNYTAFPFFVYLKAAMTNKQNLYVSFYSSGVAVSNEVVVPLSKSTINAWQTLVMQLSLFTFSQAAFDEVRFRWSMTGSLSAHAGFYLDFVKLQTGVIQQVFNSSIILEGDVTGSGVTGSPVPTTLKIVNSNVGQFGSATNVPQITVDAKGRVTAIANVAVTIPAAITPTSDATPVDTDEVVSLRGTSWLKTTWTVLKAFLKTYFDNVYAAINHAHTFLSLSDTPTNYTGSGGKIVAVKSDVSGLEFIAAPSGGGFSIVDESSGSFTASATHKNNYTRVNYASGVNVTFPKDTFSSGDSFCFEQTGNGAVSIVAGADTTISGYDGLTTYGQYAVVVVVCVASNTFVAIAGTGF